MPSRGPAASTLSRILILVIILLCPFPMEAGLPAMASDREEESLVGKVRSVETRESLMVQIDRYDADGRLIERFQGGGERARGSSSLRFLYSYDQAGRRIAEAVQDAGGKLVKETRSAYDERGNRSAEVAAWADGTFENASFYEYDEAHRPTRGLHYNAVQVINRNLYGYDHTGHVVLERLERNYRYAAAENPVATSDRFDTGYEVALTYDDGGHVHEKVVSDLRGRKQVRSEFRYDEQGSQIEELVYNAQGKLTDRKSYRYEYDAIGNWIQETFQWWEMKLGREKLKQWHVRERSILYY